MFSTIRNENGTRIVVLLAISVLLSVCLLFLNGCGRGGLFSYVENDLQNKLRKKLSEEKYQALKQSPKPPCLGKVDWYRKELYEIREQISEKYGISGWKDHVKIKGNVYGETGSDPATLNYGGGQEAFCRSAKKGLPQYGWFTFYDSDGDEPFNANHYQIMLFRAYKDKDKESWSVVLLDTNGDDILDRMRMS